VVNEYIKVKIKKIMRETKEAVTVCFEIPSEYEDLFLYKHGQYIIFRVKQAETKEERAFSISSSPHYNKHLCITVKESKDGIVSSYINNQLQVGEEVEIKPPAGKFTIELDARNTKKYFFIGGGSGISPLISIIKSTLSVEKQSKVILLYANRREESIILKNELEELEKFFENRLETINVLSKPSADWTGLANRLNKQRIIDLIIKKYLSDYPGAEYFICGPDGLNKEALAALDSLDINNEQIHMESYSAASNKPKKTESKTKENKMVKMKLYGESVEFGVEPGDDIITAALDNGHEPPFSCQVGACGSCRAKLVEGEVEMDDREALTDEEIKNGFILACQSHPTTDVVQIDFDD
jgi:ring-1,2-phenylacetyl-CoA epoxidase subunit PaaE